MSGAAKPLSGARGGEAASGSAVGRLPGTLALMVLDLSGNVPHGRPATTDGSPSFEDATS